MAWVFLQSAGPGGPGFSRGEAEGFPQPPAAALRRSCTENIVQEKPGKVNFRGENRGKIFQTGGKKAAAGIFFLFPGPGKEKKPV
jgi:hypothetical protein